MVRGGNELARDLPKQRARGQVRRQMLRLLLLNRIARVAGVDQDVSINGVHGVHPVSGAAHLPATDVDSNFR